MPKPELAILTPMGVMPADDGVAMALAAAVERGVTHRP